MKILKYLTLSIMTSLYLTQVSQTYQEHEPVATYDHTTYQKHEPAKYSPLKYFNYYANIIKYNLKYHPKTYPTNNPKYFQMNLKKAYNALTKAERKDVKQTYTDLMKKLKAEKAAPNSKTSGHKPIPITYNL